MNPVYVILFTLCKFLAVSIPIYLLTKASISVLVLLNNDVVQMGRLLTKNISLSIAFSTIRDMMVSISTSEPLNLQMILVANICVI